MLLKTAKTSSHFRKKQASLIFTSPSSEEKVLYGAFWGSESKKQEDRRYISNFSEDKIPPNTRIKCFSSSPDKKGKSNRFYFYLLLVSLLLYFLKWLYEKEPSKKEDKNKEIVNKYVLEAFKLLQEGKINKAIAPLVNAGKYFPEIYKLIKLIEADNFTDAIKLAEQIFTEKLDLGHYFILTKAIFLASLKKEAEALGCLEEVLKHAKESEIKAYAYYHKSIIFIQQKQHAKAKEEMQKATALCKNVEQFAKNYTMIEQTLRQYTKPQTNKKKKKSITKSPENRIVIRVWGKVDSSEVGHAALETNKYYISFWPSKSGNSKERKDQTHNAQHNELIQDSIDKGKKDRQGRGARHNKLIHDFIEEGRLPECRVVLYSLNVNEININYKKFIDSNHQWSLWSPNIFRSPESHNCSSLVGHLLYRAGLYGLVSYQKRYAKEIAISLIALSIGMYYLGAVTVSQVAAQMLPNPVAITAGEELLLDSLIYFNFLGVPGYFFWKTQDKMRKGAFTTPNDIAIIATLAEKTESNSYNYIDAEEKTNSAPTSFRR
jgi:tetratricopeptide (TPR) repeat protein